MMRVDDSEMIFSAESIQLSVSAIAGTLNSRCEGEWLVLCVLTGGMVFTSDLIRQLDFPILLDFLQVSRYHDETQGSELQWFAKPKSKLAGKKILLADDIFDEGKTLDALKKYCYAEGALEVLSVVLLDKQHDRRCESLNPDVSGLVCPDRYVYGYGMDYEGQYRNLADIRALAENVT